MAELKKKQQQTFDPDRGPVLSIRFALALVLVVAGIGWILYTYLGLRNADDTGFVIDFNGGPSWLDGLGLWNYAIGFGAFFLGLIVSAHPKTPLGRGRGVVVGMLGCFLLGLAWICVFYAIVNAQHDLPVFADLDQKNLIVGIAFMAVGFTFATRWE